ncbi:MAG TPA: aldo/keto reductase, partial [Polyangiaceae bacterium]|nr:aldo/keto reductase [Polyangiaceae bacterium]
MIASAREIGLGAMRLSTDEARDEAGALGVLQAALDAGVTLIDTAPTYGRDERDLHHNERLVARAVEGRPGIRVVTKCGMRREGLAWIPDGKRKTLTSGAEASAAALGVGSLDVLLLHARDPQTRIETSARALEELRRAGLARHVGLSNPTRADLEAARRVAEIEFVELELGVFADEAWKSGLARLALDAGLVVLMHSPLGGPKRAPRLARDALLRELASKHGITPGTVALAYHYGLHPRLVPIPGARRIESAVGAAQAATRSLEDEDVARLDERFAAGARAMGRHRSPPRIADAGASPREVVVIMGIQGSGKSTLARDWVTHGYERLNRDERGGSLKALAAALDARLAAGGERFVLDNTYPTRASRAEVIHVAERHGAAVRCIHLEAPPWVAERNVVRR